MGYRQYCSAVGKVDCIIDTCDSVPPLPLPPTCTPPGPPSWLAYLALLLVPLACASIYTIFKLRKVDEGTKLEKKDNSMAPDSAAYPPCSSTKSRKYKVGFREVFFKSKKIPRRDQLTMEDQQYESVIIPDKQSGPRNSSAANPSCSSTTVDERTGSGNKTEAKVKPAKAQSGKQVDSSRGGRGTRRAGGGPSAKKDARYHDEVPLGEQSDPPTKAAASSGAAKDERKRSGKGRVVPEEEARDASKGSRKERPPGSGGSANGKMGSEAKGVEIQPPKSEKKHGDPGKGSRKDRPPSSRASANGKMGSEAKGAETQPPKSEKKRGDTGKGSRKDRPPSSRASADGKMGSEAKGAETQPPKSEKKRVDAGRGKRPPSGGPSMKAKRGSTQPHKP